MISKHITYEAAIAQVPDGATILVGGFGVPGTPFSLIKELVRQGQKNLTIIKNDANEKGMGVDHLLANGQVKKLIVSHIGLNARAIELMNAGKLEVEFCAQGILAERIRCGGAGLSGFITDIAVDTQLSNGKVAIEFEGRPQIIEKSIRADFAFIHADRADPFGNLIYTATARNFNPIMAMAADKVFAEVENLVSLGGLAPDEIHTPGPFVDFIIEIEALSAEYGVVRR